MLKRRVSLPLLLFLLVFLAGTARTYGWSNGGFSSDADHPDYGTHDFLAHHALDYVPDNLDFWLRENLAVYLYGTELPDNKNAPLGDGIGDTTLHHVYYHASGQLQDDASAKRAQDSFQQTLTYLISRDYRDAAKWMGITSHYVADVAVFGHVMGKSTDWGAEKHHQDYEDWVNSNTNHYDAPLKTCLTFDGKLQQVSPYDAALALAHDTTFDDSGKGHTAKWMDDNYGPNNPTFQERTCESINLSVNILADLIYSVSTSADIPEVSQPVLLAALVMTITVLILHQPASQPSTKGKHFDAKRANGNDLTSLS
jgi:hypothetical protein